ncbi:MAG: YrdB family protein, partial [Chloroflexi bacterium]|nr:YrdB family protein [Chloroflexota bacterium]
MSKNPLNLALRFFLELAALYAMGYWAWTQNEGLLRIVLTIGLPLVAAAMWGVFRVPGDPKDAPVAIPGWLRLVLEAV